MSIHLEGVVFCQSCKKMVWMSSPHSCCDLDAERRLRELERAVVEAAEAFGVDPWRGNLEGTVIGVSMEYDANGTYVLYEDVLPIIAAVRALREGRQV